MYMYYCILSLCAIMFGTQFFFNGMFRKTYGSSFRATLVMSAGSALTGLIILTAVNGFHLSYTHFSFIMSILVMINSTCFNFCSLKALGRINLSLYSMYSMLGGMVLPFLAGVIFFGESLTLGKCLCFVFVAWALFLTAKRDNNKSGTLLYMGVFIFNGMAGVLSKIYQAAPFQKVSATEYSIHCAATALVASIVLLLFTKAENKKLNFKALFAILGSGTMNRVANLLLLVCLTFIPASAQYTFITGGTIIVSTIIAYITHQAPSKREQVSVILSFAGLLILVFVP